MSACSRCAFHDGGWNCCHPEGAWAHTCGKQPGAARSWFAGHHACSVKNASDMAFSLPWGIRLGRQPARGPKGGTLEWPAAAGHIALPEMVDISIATFVPFGGVPRDTVRKQLAFAAGITALPGIAHVRVTIDTNNVSEPLRAVVAHAQKVGRFRYPQAMPKPCGPSSLIIARLRSHFAPLSLAVGAEVEHLACAVGDGKPGDGAGARPLPHPRALKQVARAARGGPRGQPRNAAASAGTLRLPGG